MENMPEGQTNLPGFECEGISHINGHRIPLYDQNPNVTFSVSGVSGVTRQKKNKLTIKNLPLFVSNNEIVKMLTDNNVVLASPVRYGLIRDESGQLTTFKNGDCYVYVEPFNPPLPKQQNVGIFQLPRIVSWQNGSMSSLW